MVNVVESDLFPSVGYFRALATSARSDIDRYRRLGATDIALGLIVGDQAFRLEFEDYECTDISPWDSSDTGAVDCWVSASPQDWDELIAHIRSRKKADSTHTLNSLVLADDRFHLGGTSQLGMDKFYRYNATLQSFFEEASRLEG